MVQSSSVHDLHPCRRSVPRPGRIVCRAVVSKQWFKTAQCMISTRVGAPCLDRVGLSSKQWFKAVVHSSSLHDLHPCRRSVPRPGWIVVRAVVESSGSEQIDQCMISTRVGAPCLDRVGLFSKQWFKAVVQSSSTLRADRSVHDLHPCRRSVPRPGRIVFKAVVQSSGSEQLHPCRRSVPRPGWIVSRMIRAVRSGRRSS